MGFVVSKINRAARSFNVENRASRVLDREKPVPAPRHPSTLKYIHENAIAEQEKESLIQKNEELDGFLKRVYVTSHDPPAAKNQKFGKPSEKSRLPKERGIVDDNELGHFETEEFAREGKLTLRQAMELLAAKQLSPDRSSIEAVASKYKLNYKNAENILLYFGPFEVHINDTKKPQIDSQRAQSKITGATIVEIDEGTTKK